jgi:NADPH:quinone reductase-like Zn-dependent oxidoreductase
VFPVASERLTRVLQRVFYEANANGSADRPRSFQIETLRVPVPAANEVCIRLEGCGVCASNVPTWTCMPWSRYPTEPGGLGHEGWGTIEDIGAEVNRPGDSTLGKCNAKIFQGIGAKRLRQLIWRRNLLETTVSFPASRAGESLCGTSEGAPQALLRSEHDEWR